MRGVHATPCCRRTTRLMPVPNRNVFPGNDVRESARLHSGGVLTAPILLVT